MDWQGILALGALALIGGGVVYWVWRDTRRLKQARVLNEELTQENRELEAETEKLLADKKVKEMSDDDAYYNFINRRGTDPRD